MTPAKGQHTRGPWHTLAGPSAYIRIVQEGHENTIARLYRDDTPDWRANEANARLIAASPRMFQVLEQVADSPHEPDKWAQNVRFALQEADGVERRPLTAIEQRNRNRVRAAAPMLLEALQSAMRILAAIREDGYAGEALPQLDWILDGDETGDSTAIVALRAAEGE